jgi:hypothetical protein
MNRLWLSLTLFLFGSVSWSWADDGEKKVLQRIKELGGEWSGNPVNNVSLAHTGVSDADLEILSELKNLQVLYLRGTKVTDQGLKQVANLPKLWSLYLDYTKITDKGLK